MLVCSAITARGTRLGAFLKTLEKERARNRARYHANPEKQLARMRALYKAEPEKYRLRVRAFEQANPEMKRARRRLRKARKRNQTGFIPPDWEQTLLSLQRGLCFYCGTDLAQGYHLEHMIPLSKGGLHDHENTCLACPSCNLRKRTKTAEEFLSHVAA